MRQLICSVGDRFMVNLCVLIKILFSAAELKTKFCAALSVNYDFGQQVSELFAHVRQYWVNLYQLEIKATFP